MKQISRASCALLLFSFLFLSLFSCGADAPRIEEGEWSLAVVQAADGSSTPLFVSEESAAKNAALKDIPRLSLTLSAKRGTLTLHDKTANTVYQGEYELLDALSPEASDYRIRIGEEESHALLLCPTDDEGVEHPTLSLPIGEYVLIFVAS